MGGSEKKSEIICAVPTGTVLLLTRTLPERLILLNSRHTSKSILRSHEPSLLDGVGRAKIIISEFSTLLRSELVVSFLVSLRIFKISFIPGSKMGDTPLFIFSNFVVSESTHITLFP